VTVAGDGLSVIYTPAANFYGTETFACTVSDDDTADSGHKDTATGTITVNIVNDAPDAVNDTPAAVDEDSGAHSVAVLANDTDPDNVSPTAANAGLKVVAVTTGNDGELSRSPPMG
jgi:large repetitive protein